MLNIDELYTNLKVAHAELKRKHSIREKSLAAELRATRQQYIEQVERNEKLKDQFQEASNKIANQRFQLRTLNEELDYYRKNR